jgi:stage II sporulation protein P
MDHHQRSLRFGAALIAAALMFRLAGSGMFQSLANFLAQPNIASFLLYLETGRIVRFSQSPGAEDAFALESAIPDFALSAGEKPAFTPADVDSIQIKYNCSRSPDLEELITRPLEWDLTSSKPTVLIVHTHATESYTKSKGEIYRETSAFRTLDENYNMISIGDRVAELLEAGGITVLHDRQLHDYPSYNGSYNHSRASVKQYLKEHPSILLVLDLHRDASGDNRNQMKTHAVVNGQDSAQLMLVVGSDASGLTHPNWEENLALGLKLQVQLERISPGIMRYVNLRGQRFNQDLMPGMLLVEVGAAGNSHSEALNAAAVLAQGILALAEGCTTPELSS